MNPPPTNVGSTESAEVEVHGADNESNNATMSANANNKNGELMVSENVHHQSSLPHFQIRIPPTFPPITLVSTCEEMNPTRRCTFEDCAVYAPAGTWNVPDPNMAFLCICDGHGGRQMVEYLEDGLIFHVSAELGAKDEGRRTEERRTDEDAIANQESIDADILQRLERAFLMADIHSKTLGVTTSGATVAVCLITRCSSLSSKKKDNVESNEGCEWDIWTIYAANAGDARVVLGHDGQAFRMTKDHRTDDPDEVRRIEQCGGFLFKGRVLGVLAVTRSLGDHCMKEYVIAQPYSKAKAIRKDPNDDSSFVILACDGLWDVMKDQEAVDFVQRFKDEKEFVAQYLVKEALDRGSTDNITVTVAWL